MNKIVKNALKLLLLTFALFYGGKVFSEEITTFPYFNGFEDSSKDTEWVLVNGFSVNKWYIGNGVFSQGKRGLYVSGDGGNSPSYQNIPCGIGVYKEITLPAGAQYRISFSWRLQGEQTVSGAGLDSLHVYWINDPTENIYSNVTGDLPTNLINYKRNINTTEKLKGGTFWYNSSFIVNGSTTTRRLLFYWINNSSNSLPPAACIDNIQIEKIGTDVSCLRPEITSMVYEDGVKLSWTGSSSEYRLKYRKNETGVWTQVQEVIQGSPYTVTGLEKGVYTFWLQGICGTDTTAWTVSQNYLVAISTDKCLNYADLENTKTTYATYSESYGSVDQHIGLKDYGYQSIESQHTIHYLKSETDPRTLNYLKTVPEDEVASIRLGNWSPDNSSESLTYTFTVNKATPILLLKYAAVLHYSPADYGGDNNANPRLVLKVSDMLGRPIDEECFNVKIIPSPNVTGTGWHSIPVGLVIPERAGDGPICWKDWTSIGMNLSKYAGRQLKIYLETGDCHAPGNSGHFGYAYFAMDCASDKMEGLTCGAAAEKIDTVWAPKGYKYEWYRITSPTIIRSTERYLVPLPGDTATYKCRMIFNELGKENCFFELTAALLPRYPRADASYAICRRTVQFEDKSHTYTQNGNVNEQCDVYWEIGDTILTERNPVYEFPAPGTYKVILHASINDGMCNTTWEEEITVSDDTIKSYSEASICPGNYYTFGERELTQSGIYVDTLYTSYGCDSISTLKLHVFETTATDTICGGDIYSFEGEDLRLSAGLHRLVYKNIKSVFGCDSILSLYVAPEIVTSVESPTCGDAENLLVSLTSGEANSVKIEFGEEAIKSGFVNTTLPINNNTFRIPIPSPSKAGIYSGKFTFINNYCGSTEQNFDFTLLYPANIIVQRWNDVLFVKNKENNGGYYFSSYQWYVNDERIDGATGSYIYVPEGLSFDGSLYRVELTRDEDSLTLSTCPFLPTEVQTVELKLVSNISAAGSSFDLKSSKKGTVKIYSTSGLLISQQQINEGDNYLTPPTEAGFYLLKVDLEQEYSKVFTIQVLTY